MAYPEDIRPITVEILIDGAWVNISPYVLEREASSLNRGGGSEDNSMPPTTMNLLLRNGDGRFTEDNPMGPYWGQWKEGLPLRYGIVHDSVSYRRFTGEIVSIGENIGEVKADNTCTVVAGGWFSRWQRPLPIESPLTRTMLASDTLVAYWTFEDEGSNVQTLAAATPNTPPAIIKSAVGVAGNSDFTSVKPIVEMGTGQIYCPVPIYRDNGATTILHLLATSGVAADDTTVMSVQFYGGTVWRMHLLAHTNGDLRLRFYGADSTILYTGTYGGAIAVNDDPCLVLVELEQDGADIDWSIAVHYASRFSSAGSSSVATGQTMGSAQNVVYGRFNNLDAGVGHSAIHRERPTNFQEILAAFRGHLAEGAGDRFIRVCTENGIPHRFIGGTTPRMGPQPIDTVENILQECADVDHSFIFETREEMGLTMVTRQALDNQGSNRRLELDMPIVANSVSTNTIRLSPSYANRFYPGVQFRLRTIADDLLSEDTLFTVTETYEDYSDTEIGIEFTPAAADLPSTSQNVCIYRNSLLALDYAGHELQRESRPIKDDLLTANRIITQRPGGSSYTAEDTTSPRSIFESPAGIGLYERPVPINVYQDGQLGEHATWLLGLGTNSDARWPAIDIGLHSAHLSARQEDVLRTDVGFKVTIDNMQSLDNFNQARQLVRGYVETFDGNRLHHIVPTGVPENPYHILEFDSNLEFVGQGTSGTPDYLVAVEAPARDVRIGDTCYLRDSSGALKTPAVERTVTGKSTAFGFTNIEFTPVADAVTVAGDVLEVVRLDCRWAANNSTLAEPLDDTATGAVDVASGDTPWTTDVSDFPLDIIIGGERVTLSGISGAPGVPHFVGAGAGAAADNAPVTATLPTGTTSGDVVFIVAAIRSTIATVDTPTDWLDLYGVPDNLKVFARVYDGVWSMPAVSFTGGQSGDTTLAAAAAFEDIVPAESVGNLVLFDNAGNQDIKVQTQNMNKVLGQRGLRLAIGHKWLNWTSVAVDPDSGFTTINSVSSTLGNDAALTWAYAIDGVSGHYPERHALWTVTGGSFAVCESRVMFFPATPQTFTISERSVNGVVKSHEVGASVDTAEPFNYGL